MQSGTAKIIIASYLAGACSQYSGKNTENVPFACGTSMKRHKVEILERLRRRGE